MAPSPTALAAAAHKAQSYPTYVYVIAALALLVVITTVIVVIVAVRRKKAADAARAAADGPATPDPSAAIRAAFAATEQRLQQKVPDRRIRDAIPRLLVLGEPGSGKTTLLGATLLNTPLDKADDPRPGDGAPVHLWTFDKAVVVDPTGSIFLTPKGEEPEPPAGLDALVTALKKGRPGRPIDGMLLTIPCSDLDPHGQSTDDDRKRKATTLHKQIGDIQRKLGMSVPVYVLVTKCDEALASFRSFGAEVGPRQGILGWSRPDPDGPIAAARAQDGPAPDFVSNAMKSLEDRLSERQVARFLGDHAPIAGGAGQERLGKADGLFLFPTELRNIESALRVYVDEIFVPSVYDELFELRGIYFCGDGGNRLAAAPTVATAVMGGAPPPLPAASARGVLFVRKLFEDKIIPEANLARPSQGVLGSRKRLILGLQIAALVAGLIAGVGLTLELERLRSDSASLLEAITAVKDASSAPDSASSEVRGERVKSVLNAFKGIRADHMATWVLPLSHLSLRAGGIDHRLQAAIKVGYEDLILPAFEQELRKKAVDLTKDDAPQGLITPQNLESSPQFFRLDHWLGRVGVLDTEIKRYNDLAHAATVTTSAEEDRESKRRLDDIAELADYLFEYRAEPSFYSDSRYYRLVLAHGVDLTEFTMDGDSKTLVIKKLHELTEKLIEAMRLLYKDKIVHTDLQGLETGFRRMEKEPGEPEGIDLDALRQLRRVMDKTSADLHDPLLAWVPTKVPPADQGLDRLLDNIAASPLLGDAEARLLRDDAQERLLLLESEIEDATTELTGSVLKREDDNLKMTLADEVVAFKKPIDALLAERFMAAGDPDDWPKPDERMTWDIELLKDASAMLKEYDAFDESGQFKQFRGVTSGVPQEIKHASQDAVTKLAKQRLRSRLVDRAIGAVLPEGGQLRGAPLAERTRTDVENLRLAAPAIREVLGAFIRFGWKEDRDKLREIVRVQGSRLLKDAYGVLSDKHLYGVRGDSFSWWNFDETPAFEAYRVADGAALAEFVAGERQQAAATATEFAQPVITLLESPEVGSDSISARWQNAWRGVVAPLAAYDAKQPGNGVSILESFILTELPTIKLDNCFNRISADPARDFFTEKKQHIINILQKRCSQRSGETIETRYFKLASAFRSQLAGRFPFAKADLTNRIDDAPPEAVRSFLDDEAAFTKVYRGELVRRGIEDKDATRAESARKVVRFLDQMEKVRAFLGPMWGQTDSAADGAFDVTVEFRANPAHENRGNQIAAWTMDFPEKRLTLGAIAGEKQVAHWRMDDGVPADPPVGEEQPRGPHPPPGGADQPRRGPRPPGVVRDQRDVGAAPLHRLVPDAGARLGQRGRLDRRLRGLQRADQARLRRRLRRSDRHRLGQGQGLPPAGPRRWGQEEGQRVPGVPRDRALHGVKDPVSMPADFPPKNLDDLLQPIAPDAPAGSSLRYDGTYDKIRAARRADDPSLPQGEWETTLKKADFDGAASLCFDALAHRSKDLQLAVWLIEAWVQTQGLPGLAPGLSTLAGLCEHFWDTMFPPLADGGVETRAELIDWLDDTIALRLRLVPLSDAASGAAYSLSEWEAARGRSSRSQPQEGALTWETVLTQTSLAGRTHWMDLHGQVGVALRAIDGAELALAARAPDPPTLRRTRGALTAIAGVVEQAIRAFGGQVPPPDDHAADPDGARAAYAPGNAIQSRGEAYLRLTEAADFLLRTEPHSPVPYLIMRAVSWGNMSLAELLHEFVGGADDLVAIQVLLGMRKKE